MSPIAESVTRQLVQNEQLRAEGFEYHHIELRTMYFPSGEVMPKIVETIRSAWVYLFHCPYWPNTNTGLMEILLATHAIGLASADKLTIISPYFPYTRQDRRYEDEDGEIQRVPISSRRIGDFIYRDRVVRNFITFDLHSEQGEAFFDGPVQNLPGRRIFVDYFREKFANDFSNVVICSTDVGGSKRIERLANALDPDMPIGIIRKSRKKDSVSQVKTLGYIGDDVRGKVVILNDDILDSGNSMIAAIKAIMELGAKEVIATATHGTLVSDEHGTAESKFKALGVEVKILDTIPRSQQYRDENASWLEMLPIDDFLGRVVCETHRSGGSINQIRR